MATFKNSEDKYYFLSNSAYGEKNINNIISDDHFSIFTPISGDPFGIFDVDPDTLEQGEIEFTRLPIGDVSILKTVEGDLFDLNDDVEEVGGLEVIETTPLSETSIFTTVDADTINLDTDVEEVGGLKVIETTPLPIADASTTTAVNSFEMGEITRLPVELSDEDISIYLPQGGNDIDLETGNGEVIEIEPAQIAMIVSNNVDDSSVLTPVDGDPFGIFGLDTGSIESGEVAQFESTPLPVDGVFTTVDADAINLDADVEYVGGLEVVGTIPLPEAVTGDLLI